MDKRNHGRTEKRSYYLSYDTETIKDKKKWETGVRIDIWTHFMRGCIINYVH